jgi:hypothetical protein
VSLSAAVAASLGDKQPVPAPASSVPSVPSTPAVREEPAAKPPAPAPAVSAAELWPQFAARADGLPREAMPDDWNRTVVEVPAGARRLTVRFEPGWARGLVPAAVLVLLGGLTGVACARLAGRAPVAPGSARP